MDKPTYLAYLEADYQRLREVAADALNEQVPSCPEWTVTDLVRHVAQVYLHKTEIMRTGKAPEPWPPDLTGEDPIAALDRAYRGLVAELTEREVDAHAHTWFEPDQTVGFWVRRMAQETVIHRVDAELGAGVALAPIPADLAVDGIDEVLATFLSYHSHGWPDDFGDLLAKADGRAVSVDAGTASWSVRPTPKGVDVTTDGATDARVSGEPDKLLLWLWRRASNDAVKLDGDTRLVDKLHDLLGPATQ